MLIILFYIRVQLLEQFIFLYFWLLTFMFSTCINFCICFSSSSRLFGIIFWVIGNIRWIMNLDSFRFFWSFRVLADCFKIGLGDRVLQKVILNAPFRFYLTLLLNMTFYVYYTSRIIQIKHFIMWDIVCQILIRPKFLELGILSHIVRGVILASLE